MKNMEKHPSSSTTCCIQSVKDTKFKAIHNVVVIFPNITKLYSICQRYII